ncbi:MAG: ABC transporter permease [Clostridia bacterium]|nr:ABC transporter permease [Clostridia bacterium]
MTEGRRAVWKRLLGDPVVALAGALLAAVVLASLGAPVLAPESPTEIHLGDRLLPPFSPGHLLGTDHLGRDMLSRLLYGGRLSLLVGFAAVALAMSLGTLIGLVTGYYGGWADSVLMRAMDVLMAFPAVLLAIAVIAALGPGLLNAMLAVAVVGIPYYTRIVRASALSLRGREFIEAERAAGASDLLILWRHVLPNSLSPLIVAATLDVGWMIMAAAGLSFLGLGAQPPRAEWGVMLSEGRQFMRVDPFESILPGFAIFLVVLCLNILGDGLRDALDPRSEGGRPRG